MSKLIAAFNGTKVELDALMETGYFEQVLEASAIMRESYVN